MRTRTLAERNAIKDPHPNHYIKIEVENADRVYQDLTNLSGVDWIESGDWGDSIDQPTGTFTLNLRRDATSPSNLSLAPTWGASPLNRDSSAAYAPLLDPGRQVRITTAVTANGVAPVLADWKLAFIGRIDTVDWHATPIVVTGRDLGGWVADKFIEEERAYGVAGPEAIESVMGDILTDWHPFGSPSIYTPVSPGWMINNTVNKKQDRKTVLEALQQDWALSIGWQLRYKFDASDNYRFTFYEIDRTNTTPDDTFGPTEYRDVTGLSIEDADVRNKIVGKFFDSGGTPRTRTAVDTTSQTKYGVKYMEISLANGDPINTDAEMDLLLDAAKSDLGSPFAVQTVETLYYWPAELGDLYTFQANADHYDDDQDLGIVGIRHAFAEGQIVTTLQCAGGVKGSFHAWFRKGLGATGDVSEPSIVVKSLNNLKWTDSADGTTRTFTWEPGALVIKVYVYDTLESTPPSADPWPVIGTLPTSILSLGVNSYTATKPKNGFQRFVQLEPRLSTFDAGYVRRIVLDPAPAALSSKISATVVSDLASLVVEVKAGVSDWPVTVDIFEDDPAGSPILTKVISANATLNSGTDAILGSRQLPQREARRWYVRLTNIAGAEEWSSAAADRDALPSGTVNISDYRSAPILTLLFDDDTDAIRITTPTSKTKTAQRSDGSLTGGSFVFTIGDAMDGIFTPEAALGVDETRGTYLVEFQGGGDWLPIWTGPLHGQPSNPPTVRPRVSISTNRDAADVYVIVETSVNELITLKVRDAEDGAAPVYTLCVSAGDSTPLSVTNGTEIGPSHFFTSGGSPVAKFSGVPLVRDQVKRIYVQAIGASSGIASAWIPITLSVKEQPWIESIAATWDDASGNLRVRVKGGANCASVFVEISASPTFVSPTTDTQNIVDGGEVISTFALTGAQRGKTWYARATPFNATALGGLSGVGQVDEIAVPAQFTLSSAATENSSTGQGTLTLTVSDPGLVIDQIVKIRFYKTVLGTRAGPNVATSAPAGTTGDFVYTFALDPKHNVKIEPVIAFADGSTRVVGAWTFDSDKNANVLNLTVSVDAVNANAVAYFDTDTVIGAATGRYRVNGGGFTTFAVGSDYTGTFSVSLTGSTQTLEVQGQDSDGNWGPSATTKIPPVVSPTGAPAISQGTVDVDSNGVWSFTTDVPNTSQSIKYLTSTSAFPADATVSSSGSLIGSLAGATVVSITNGGTLSFGQTLFVTIIPFTGSSGTGTAGQPIHIRGAYLSYTATKTVNYARSSFHTSYQTGSGPLNPIYDTNFSPTNPAMVATGLIYMTMMIALPAGVTLSQASFLGTWNSATTALGAYNVAVYKNATLQNNGSFTSAAGAQTKNVSLSGVLGGSESITLFTSFTGPASGTADVGQAIVGDVAVSYSMPDPKTTI